MEEYLSFDDVQLIPQRGIVNSRKDIELRCKLTNKIELNLPLISANMDSITEAKMAITMARMGGIGILHRFCTIEEQCRMVKEVKRAQNIIINDPFVFRPTKESTLQDLINYLETKKINSVPIIDSNEILYKLEYERETINDGYFIGIVNKRRLLQFPEQFRTYLISEIHEKYEKIFEKNYYSYHMTYNTQPTIEECKEIFMNNNISKIYLFYSEDRKELEELKVFKRNIFFGLITLKDFENTQKYPLMSIDKKGKLLVGAAIGVKDDYLTRAKALIDRDTDVLVIDIAHGHSNICIQAIKEVKKIIKEHNKNTQLIAGNVCTLTGAFDLQNAGADAIKIGVGPGAVCTTRRVTGFGLPQFSTLQNISKKYSDIYVPLIADGGIRYSGDIVKSLLYADTVMMGSILSGTEETPGKIINKEGKKYKVYRGMAGTMANLAKEEKMNKNFNTDIYEIAEEGIDKLVEYKGSAISIIKNLADGIRSGVSYSGNDSLKSFKDNKVGIVKITNSGIIESGTR